MDKNIWLSREGAMSGPLGEDELETLRASGELSRYGWIWRKSSGQWMPVHPRPTAAPIAATPVTTAPAAAAAAAAPTEPVASATPVAPPAASAMPTAKPSVIAPSSGATASPSAASAHVAPVRALHVICHDQRHVVSGMVQSLREGGCIVSSDQGLSDFPVFRKGAKISVNLLDEAMDRAENVEATVASVRKHDDPERWCYDLDWSQRPEIIKGNS